MQPDTFKQAFAQLNERQRQAVEQIDGPLLVVAGPGTGKTQLLSARVAYILQQTDTLPQNILCLTFTESGAANMRERLSSFIGQAAYDVSISTYHAFGGELIGRFPQYFGEHRLQSAADGLVQRQIVQDLVEAMPFSNPLKSSRHHLHDLLSTISEVKRGLLTEADLRAIAEDNLAFLAEANAELAEIFADFTKMPAKFDDALPFFDNLLRYLSSRDQEDYRFGVGGPAAIQPLAQVVQYELAQAIAEASTAPGRGGKGQGSTKPLTAWKNQWLEKDADNHLVLAGSRESQRIAALADVLEQYTDALAKRVMYDFDDMILRSIRALEQHADLRFTLQEQYQYILLDEFQDTNAAQLKLIKLLTDNPVNEGRPNVMAVGDDDQAIYAFQGAEVSNMLEFANMYRDTAVINLTENYRSHPQILHVAREVAEQIGSRLTNSFKDMSKILAAANQDIPATAQIDRHEFQADVGQYAWLAEQIAEQIKQGTPASEIAVLAPRHKQLEPLVAYLNRLEIPVRYEKRENILEAPIVQQLLNLSRLVLALRDEPSGRDNSDSMWPEVLSYNFWQLPTSVIWQLSWDVRSSKELRWSQAVLGNQHTRPAGLLLLALAGQATTETLETTIDRLIGNEPVATGESDLPKVVSPLKEFYLGQVAQTEGPDLFYQTLSHLTCLRERLRDHQTSQDDPLKLPDLLAFVQLYQDAGERLLNTSPYNQHAEAVQLMTVFKAKGLEFEQVFLPSVQDDVWGESSRAQSNRLTLPPNLAPIRPAGTTQDERLRIFFVAITRAKIGLHLASYLQTYSGRNTKRLKYLNEQPKTDGSGYKTLILPAEVQDVRRIDNHREVPALETLELNWRQRHVAGLQDTTLRDILNERLANYQLSPTHLRTFIDVMYSGPQDWLLGNLLQFPSAPSSDAQYGNAIHETLQWYQMELNTNKAAPAYKSIHQQFAARLTMQHLRADQHNLYLVRGNKVLDTYLAERGGSFQIGDKAEHNFRYENVRLGGVDQTIPLTGKIDRLHIDQATKTITIYDYKTGPSHSRWTSDSRLHHFKLQLYFYKLLVNNSHSFRGYTVEQGVLEFVEPDDNGRIHHLALDYKDKEQAEAERLIRAVWRHMRQLQLPDISDYDLSLSGIKQFEAALLKS